MAKVIKHRSAIDSQEPAEALSPTSPAWPQESEANHDESVTLAANSSSEVISKAEHIAQQLMAEAETQAQQIRQAAADQVAAAEKQGYDEGFERGLAEAGQQVAGILQSFAVRQSTIEEEFLPQIADLAIHIARRILHQELEFNPEALVDIARWALHEKARQRRDLVLRVNPEDGKALRANQGKLIEMLSRTPQIVIQDDESVALHGLIIETEAGSIDAQLETQLSIFHHALSEVPL